MSPVLSYTMMPVLKTGLHSGFVEVMFTVKGASSLNNGGNGSGPAYSTYNYYDLIYLCMIIDYIAIAN